MAKLLESLGITTLSTSQVSTMATQLVAHAADFRTRPLDQGLTPSLPPTPWGSKSAKAARVQRARHAATAAEWLLAGQAITLVTSGASSSDCDRCLHAGSAHASTGKTLAAVPSYI
jgi:hypothetical protein